MRIGSCRREQIGMHRHFRRGADQDEAGDAAGMARRGFQRDQRAHAVSDEEGALDAGGLDQPRGPIGEGADAGQRRSGGQAMTGKINGEHARAVMREPSALQRKDAVIHAGAVQEDDQRLAEFMRSVARSGEDRRAVDFKSHLFSSSARRAGPERDRR